jgi:hypothetical protein
MEEKTQSNQNPDINLEEKPETTTNKKVEVKAQIESKEKEEIVNLLSSNPKKEKEVETADKKQISDSEKNEIVIMLGGKTEIHHFMYEDIDYDHLNRQELVELLEEIVAETDVSKIKKQVAEIKTHFHNINKEEIENQLQIFVSEGGNKDDFKHSADELENKFNSAFGIYRHNKAKFSQSLERQKLVNLDLKHKILDDLKELINSEETLKKTYDEFKNLQEKWKEIGMVPAAELSELWRNYHFLVEMFFDKVRINKELRDLDLKKNLEAKIDLCEKAEELLLEDSVLKSFKLLQKYHEEYREIGPVPLDKKDQLWDRFKAATEKINLIRRDYYSGIEETQKKNYSAKLELIEQAKVVVASDFDSVKDWNSGTDKVNNLLSVWKTIGRVPKEHNDVVWETFRGELNSFFERKRKYFAEVKDQQMNNYNLKLGLCAEAEAIKTSEDWKKTTQELIKLQKQWKEVGPVPRRNSDKIWKRFRAACDEFFDRKTAHFKGRKDEEKENLEKKKLLIQKILEIKPVANKKDNIETLKAVQREWVEIGYVPFDKKDKLHIDYRAAVDELVSKMEIKKSELSADEFKDRMELMKNSPDADRVIDREKSFLNNKIKKLQEDVNLWENNIGFFSISNKNSTFKDQFQKKIDVAKREIEAIKTKIKMLRDS